MRISLFGYGKVNQALAKRLAPCDIYDDSFTDSRTDALKNRHLKVDDFNPEASDVEIATPGIPPYHTLIRRAKHVISEYDLFAPKMPYSIWISGTNGKTTTTQMLHHLLAPKGAECGGNIGTPLAELNEQASMWVLETSSFMLHYTRFARPNLYILLPLSEDHISWHGSFEKYKEAKLKPLNMMRDKEIALVPKEFLKVNTNAELIGYEDSHELAQIMGIELSKIPFEEPFLLDALLALSAYKILYSEIPYERLAEFTIGAHKLEEFYDSANRLFVDDSKATNIDATLHALKRYQERKIHLILGGDDKGADLAPLFRELPKYDVIIYSIGSNAKKIAKICGNLKLPCHACEKLQIAVTKIKEALKEHEVALLSPAAASLDQFHSYKERGELFKQYALS